MRQAPASPAKILVVDDDEGLLILMAEALRAEGHDVATAYSGEEAQRLLEKDGADLLLLDLKMKGIAGQTLVERLRQARSKIPFIVVTGQGDERIAVEVMKLGALDYVMKDSGLLELLPTVVRRALGVVEADRALAAARVERRRLENELLQIGERERRRIGADLHDGLGQRLTAIELFWSSLKGDLAADRPDLAQQLGRMGEMLRGAIAQTRALAHGLVPIGEDPGALQAALAALAEEAGSLTALRCRFDCPDPVELGNFVAAGQLYRIAQEAVNNAMKHSQARSLVIRLLRRGGRVRLEIEDDGIGLSRRRKGGGRGLEVMKHRASLIGAELRLSSKRGKGTTLVCDLPDPA